MIEITDTHKLIILVLIILVAGYLLVMNDKKPIKNTGELTLTQPIQTQHQPVKSTEATNDLLESLSSVETNTEQPTTDTTITYSDISNDTQKLLKKFKTRDSATNDEYSYSSYVSGKRPLKKHKKSKLHNQTINPYDGEDLNQGTSDQYAPYIGKKKKSKQSDIDKFDIGNMLPQEQHDDWFDQPLKELDQAKIKDPKLINIVRPVGVNTVGTSRKYASHDIRPVPPNPKYVVSPWNNSSVEPDRNGRANLC